ncbi:WD repeat-containing protein on Y chromosome-like isoform X2 [Hemicordylus capensis]|uniref:WD repeat-containing protein on Y chromosome-like isoform X2 n=1 Tax=Hemicordylus capensis TaxID=884348 RepID=UPI002303C338|nr:WD repeat-containing protein on Y chromosome-like isoform X2 [Hemicordylus capensis]
MLDQSKAGGFAMEEHHQRPKQIPSLLYPPKVTETPHREPLLYISSTANGNIIGVGQDGLVSIWTTNLKLKKSSLILGESANKLQNRKMKWVSDSILMPPYKKLIIGTCDREIRLYELTNLEPYCQIIGFETMPLHLDYSVRGEGECVIAYGDEQGCVNILLINSVAETLRNWTKYPVVEEIPTVSLDAIHDSENITFIRWKVHNDWVTKIKYIHSMESIVSSSNDDCTALVIGSVSGTKNLKHRLKILMGSSNGSLNQFPAPVKGSAPKRFRCDESVFKVHKGVKTFDYSRESNLLVTGGLDRNLRLWNPYVSGWSLGILRGHTSPIGFLCILHGTKVFSVSLDSTIRVWDTEDHSCLLTVIPKASQIRGEMEVCYFSPDLRTLYVAAETFGLLRFRHQENQIRDSGMSHNEPIVCCQYNKQSQHVISCSEDSVIKVWDLKNGQLVIKVCEAHGDSAITCMAFDASGKRLITGGRDGSLKKWDSSTLHCMHTIKQATSSADEVIACTYGDVYNKRYIISVGSGRKTSIFPDLNDEISEGSYPQLDWMENVENGHKDDILCVASCPPHFLATSSFDGEIIIWNLVSGYPYSRLSTISRTMMEGGTDDLSISKIIFLLSRLERKKTAAVLVASGPRGYITFWNVCGRGKRLAYFSSSKEKSIISDIAVSDDDSLLCAGDQQGSLCIWNIAEYATWGPETKPPAVLLSWRAHRCSITSVTLLSDYQLLLTSSLDCSVKLWSLEGQYVGMFGQKELWNITDTSSWRQSDNNIHSETDADSFGQESPDKSFAKQRASNLNFEDDPIQDIRIVKARDDEIAEELKQRQKPRTQRRPNKYQLKPLQERASLATTTYHSLPLCELTCVTAVFQKPNLAGLDDPFRTVL